MCLAAVQEATMADPEPTTISAHDSIITLISTFICAEVHQEELVTELDKATEEIFRHQPGFISGNIHASLDRTRVINYAQWASLDDFDALQKLPEVQRHLAQVMTLVESSDPRLCTVRATYHA
jgi:quinol monooxygenase YgiN